MASTLSFTDSETINNSDFTISNTTIKIATFTSTRKNCSYTIFFFRVEENLAYCKICEMKTRNKAAYGYNRKSENTSNFIAHL